MTPYPLRIVQPSFASPLTDVIIELDHLRRLQLAGDTPPRIFFQLKAIFHMMESLGSARIEGNHTTLADYIESKINVGGNSATNDRGQQADLLHPNEPLREIDNIESAMDHVEQAVTAGNAITHVLIRESHSITVNGLSREGDRTPGAYRSQNVSIAGAEHIPPDLRSVQPLMDELLDFVNADDAPKYDLLKVALAHHRFAWIHPFSNGNGRVVRLFTYALLLKYGFNVNQGGRLNPTAVFCNERDRYYAMLAAADDGSNQGLEGWSLYVLEGIRDELVKVDQLARYEVLKRDILLPALAWSRHRGQIDTDEEKLLQMAVHKGVFKAADVDTVMPHWTLRQRTYQLNKLVGARMVQAVQPGARSYTLDFLNGALLRGVMRMLQDRGYAPALG